MTNSTHYVEYRNVRDATNEFENLRITYELCTQINYKNDDVIKCQLHAYQRALSIDA